MTKKQKQPKQQKRPQTKLQSSVNATVQASQQKNLRQRQLTEFISQKKSQEQLCIKKAPELEIQAVRKQSLHQQKQKPSAPTKLKKKISKKKKGKSKADSQMKKGEVKLQRGYKFCQNCHTILNIHKYVCTQCGFVHNMKKHKFDVMKNLSKGTPKIVKSIIEANEFNTIKLITSNHASLFFSSFLLENLQKDIQPQLQHRKSHDNELKRSKSQSNGQKVTLNRGKSQSSAVNKKLENKESEPLIAFNSTKIISFCPIKITKIDQLHETRSEEKTPKKYNKTRQEFSIYQSNYPITAMEPIQIQSYQKSIQNKQFLLFTESISKKEIFNQQTDLFHEFIREQRDEIESLNFDSNSESDNINNQEKSANTKKQTKTAMTKRQQERKNIKNMIQRNTTTQKAFRLEKFNRIGALYDGQTIINLMNVNKQKNFYPLQQKIAEEKTRRPSGRQSKQSSKVAQTDQNFFYENEYEVLKIGIKQHAQTIKSIKNKLAILTGKKSILLMNVNLFGEQSQQTQKEERKHFKPSNHDRIPWLNSSDFDDQSNHFMSSNKKQSNSKRYLTKISLSTTDIPSIEDDKFMVIEWLKLFSQYKENQNDGNEKRITYLAAGTLNGHIIVYSISPQNSFTIYRTIIGAHFEFINCIKQCPLNIGGTSIFASASFDGSVKVWDLSHKNTICEFEVSNRKIQEIHWDSGAKFLIVVRDEGLENCYLTCFYSVSNRVELPIMLTDSIDFRLIRNGFLFDNSCSPLIAFPLNSKLVVMLNSRNGFLKILQTEELRKTSLKRKKSKKNCQQEIYHDYWIRMNQKKMIQSNQVIKGEKEIESILNISQSHQVIQMIANVNSGLYSKLGFSSLQEHQDQHENQNVLSVDNDSHSDDSNKKSDSFDKKHLALNKKPEKNSKRPVNKMQKNPQPVETVGLRKSLRVRKPNVQYNFIEEQEPQQEEKPKKSLPKKKAGRKKQKSDQQSFFDEEEDSSQPEDSESDNSYVQQKKNKNHFSQEKVKKLKQKTRQSKNQKPQIKIGIKANQSKAILNRNPSKNIQENENDLGPTAQELLCRLFWQQTSEENLVNQKEDYPSNKLPKFSSIVSFVTSFQANDNLNGSDEVKAVQEEKKNSSDSESSSQNSPKAGLCHKNSNGKRQNLGQSQEISKKAQNNFEYLTTFIAGYAGQLIRVKVKVQSYQKNDENETKN